MKALERWAIDSFFGGAVLKDVVRACVSGDTIDRIRSFLDEHAAVFEGAVSGEHKLEYTIVHKQYCELIEAQLAEALVKHKKTPQEFFEICKKVQSATEADIQPFIQVLLAASDYMLFADIMLGGTEKRKYFVSILVGLQADFRRELGDSS